MKCSIAHTTPNNSSLLVEYFSSREFKNRDAYAKATQPSAECCSNAAPKPVLDASQTMRVSKCWSKCLFCVIFATSCRMFLKAKLCSGNQLIGLFFSVFFKSGRRAAAVCAKFGMYLVRW